MTVKQYMFYHSNKKVQFKKLSRNLCIQFSHSSLGMETFICTIRMKGLSWEMP
jgi:hypothetical protein